MGNKKIKIIYLAESLNSGGAEQLLLTTLKYLDRKRFEPLVYCLKEKGKIGDEIEKQAGVRVVYLGLRSSRLWDAAAVIRLSKAFLKEKPEILHSSLFYPNYFGRLAAMVARVPVIVVTEHGTHSNFKKFYHHWIDYALSLPTDKIIAVSEAVKVYLLRHSKVNPAKIKVMYNAVDFNFFDSEQATDKARAKREIGFADSDIIFSCVSTLLPWKGQEVLIEAFKTISDAFPMAILCLTGRDVTGFKRKLEDYAAQKGIRQKVFFMGERRDIPKILKASDVFVFPSFTEGLGISMLEAMYMGLAPVASATEGILEVVDNGKDGLLFPCGSAAGLADRAIFLLSNPKQQEEMGRLAREKVKRLFSPEAYAGRIHSFYEGLALK